MPKPLTKPPVYPLSLTREALEAAMGLKRPTSQPLFKGTKMAVQHPSGKVVIGISFSLLDQLQTAALPKENLSDTILRLYPAAPAA